MKKNKLAYIVKCTILTFIIFIVHHFQISMDNKIKFNNAYALINPPADPDPDGETNNNDGYWNLDEILSGDAGGGGTYFNVGGQWSYCPTCAYHVNIQEVVVYGTWNPPVLPYRPVDYSISNIWNRSPYSDSWYYWDYNSASSGEWKEAPSSSSIKTAMGDPIDPISGLADVTHRFEEDMQNALIQFCQVRHEFTQLLENYTALHYIFTYPNDFIDYMTYFVNEVESGGPWDLKAEGNGYSPEDLNFRSSAIFNGVEYRNDDFGNITFGIAAAAYGFPLEFAKTGAGLYQLYRGTSHWSYISSYFDDPQDSQMIELGYDYFYQMGGCN